MEIVGVKFDPRHWEALASGLADSGSRVERLHLVEVMVAMMTMKMVTMVMVTMMTMVTMTMVMKLRGGRVYLPKHLSFLLILCLTLLSFPTQVVVEDDTLVQVVKALTSVVQVRKKVLHRCSSKDLKIKRFLFGIRVV